MLSNQSFRNLSCLFLFKSLWEENFLSFSMFNNIRNYDNFIEKNLIIYFLENINIKTKRDNFFSFKFSKLNKNSF